MQIWSQTVMPVERIKSKTDFRIRMAAAVVLAALAFMTANVQSCFAQQQKTFSSAEAATRALFLAAQAHDERALTDILGLAKEVVSSGEKSLLLLGKAGL